MPQGKQSAAPLLGWWKPTAQLLHDLESKAPDEGKAVPAVQEVQVADPEELEYAPGRQAEHALADDEEYKPGAHSAQPDEAGIA